MIARGQIDAAVVQAQLQECKLCKITIELSGLRLKEVRGG